MIDQYRPKYVNFSFDRNWKTSSSRLLILIMFYWNSVHSTFNEILWIRSNSELWIQAEIGVNQYMSKKFGLLSSYLKSFSKVPLFTDRHLQQKQPRKLYQKHPDPPKFQSNSPPPKFEKSRKHAFQSPIMQLQNFHRPESRGRSAARRAQALCSAAALTFRSPINRADINRHSPPRNHGRARTRPEKELARAHERERCFGASLNDNVAPSPSRSRARAIITR